jgi:hypothetical protein
MKQIFRQYGAVLLAGTAVLSALSLILAGSSGQNTGFFSAAGGLVSENWAGGEAGTPEEKGAEHMPDLSEEKNRPQLTLKPGILSAGQEYAAEDLFSASDRQGRPVQVKLYAAAVRPAADCRISRKNSDGRQYLFFQQAGIYEAEICLTDRRGFVFRRSCRIPVDCGKNRE